MNKCDILLVNHQLINIFFNNEKKTSMDVIEQWIRKYSDLRFKKGSSFDIPAGEIIPFRLSHIILWLLRQPMDTTVDLHPQVGRKIYRLSVKAQSYIVLSLWQKKGMWFTYTSCYNMKRDLLSSLEAIDLCLSESGLIGVDHFNGQRNDDKMTQAMENKKIIDKLRINLADINHQFKMDKCEITGCDSLPVFLDTSGKRHQININLNSMSKATDRVIDVISNEEAYIYEIKKIINSYLIFHTYVGRVYSIDIRIDYSTKTSIYLTVVIELITNEDYYRTIGYAESQLSFIQHIENIEERKEKLTELCSQWKLETDAEKVASTLSLLTWSDVCM